MTELEFEPPSPPEPLPCTTVLGGSLPHRAGSTGSVATLLPRAPQAEVASGFLTSLRCGVTGEVGGSILLRANL